MNHVKFNGTLDDELVEIILPLESLMLACNQSENVYMAGITTIPMDDFIAIDDVTYYKLQKIMKPQRA